MCKLGSFQLKLPSLHLDPDDVGRLLVRLQHLPSLVVVAGGHGVAAHQLGQTVHADVRPANHLEHRVAQHFRELF